MVAASGAVAHALVAIRRRGGLGVDVLAVSALLLAILAPLLFQPGYILLHDWAWTPSGMAFTPLRHVPEHELWGNGIYPLNWVPLQVTLEALGRVLPQALVQRLFLLGIFGLLAVGAWRLAPLQGRLPRLYVVALAIVNPWVHDRLLIGQWFALAGIAVLPWALRAVLDALRTSDARSLLRAAAWWAALGVADTHAFALFALVPCTTAAVYTAAEPQRWRRLAGRVAMLAVLVAALAAYWLVPALRETSGLEQVTRADLDVFATRGERPLGLLFNSLSMHGFWYDEAASKTGLPIWWGLFLVIFAVAAAGLYRALRSDEHHAAAFAVAVAGVVAWLLSMGASGPTGWAYVWAFEHIPAMKGLREAQRAAALLPLVYGYLGAFAVQRIAAATEGKPDFERVAPVLLLLLVVLVYSFRVFWGGLGRLTPSEYPQSWAEMRVIAARERESALLVLPWHRFMRLPFTGELNVLNPAPRYFGGTVFAGDNDELPLASAVSSDRRLRYVEALLGRQAVIEDFGNLLSVIGVRHVFLVRGPGYDFDRAFLERQRDLRLVREWEDAVLFTNERPATLFYASSEIRFATDIDDLVREARELPLTSYVWLPPGYEAPAGAAAAAGALRVRRNGSGRAAFRIEEPGGAYLQTAAIPPSADWTLDGVRPLTTVAPVLAYPGSEGVLRQQATADVIRTYALSAATFVAVLSILALARQRRPHQR